MRVSEGGGPAATGWPRTDRSADTLLLLPPPSSENEGEEGGTGGDAARGRRHSLVTNRHTPRRTPPPRDEAWVAHIASTLWRVVVVRLELRFAPLWMFTTFFFSLTI